MKVTPLPTIHFPLARERGPFPFPTAKSMATQTGEPVDARPSAEELRLMADTVPGDGPGD